MQQDTRQFVSYEYTDDNKLVQKINNQCEISAAFHSTLQRWKPDWEHEDKRQSREKLVMKWWIHNS